MIVRPYGWLVVVVLIRWAFSFGGFWFDGLAGSGGLGRQDSLCIVVSVRPGVRIFLCSVFSVAHIGNPP